MSLKADLHAHAGSFRLDMDLQAASGETVALLGPNGAGKSTVARVLAGLHPIDEGRIVLGGTVLEKPADGIRLPPQARSVGFLFQNLLLFPSMNARENVAFGLRARGIGKGEALAAADNWLDRFGVGRLAAARSDTLSGGEAQRVALARALAPEPDLLLLDEPLSSLDVESRRSAARLLREVLADFDGVKMLVTHEPVEAITLSDRLVILEEGRIVQEGKPGEVRRRPRSPYVAAFVGLNLFTGSIFHETGHSIVRAPDGEVHALKSDLPEGADVIATIHPRAVALSHRRPVGSPRNVRKGTIGSIDITGDSVRVWLDTKPPLTVEITQNALVDLGLSEGREVWASFKATEVDLYPR